MTHASASRMRLPDGTEVEVRPLERYDRAELAEGTARLSSNTRYLRFMSPKQDLTPRDLDHLTDIDHHGHEALVAIDLTTREGVAVARYVELAAEPGVVDVAVTVNDAWQGRGLGTLLLLRLLDRAREEGHVTGRGTALAENAASLAMLRRAGFERRSQDGQLVEMERPLAATHRSPTR